MGFEVHLMDMPCATVHPGQRAVVMREGGDVVRRALHLVAWSVIPDHGDTVRQVSPKLGVL
jgi:hypothetical protein